MVSTEHIQAPKLDNRIGHCIDTSHHPILRVGGQPILAIAENLGALEGQFITLTALLGVQEPMSVGR
jgi:hypothetical protein